MKVFNNALASAVEVISSWKFIGRKTGGKLRNLDYAILEVAMMISALDGAISTSEVSAFEKLFAKCRGYSPKFSKLVFDRAIRKAGYMMALATTGVYTASERVAAFVDEAVKSMPSGFVDGSVQDVRRAFVMWVSMAVADGDFSDVERKAIEAIRVRFAELRVDRADAATLAWLAAFPGYGGIAAGVPAQALKMPRKTIRVLDADFIARVEELVMKMNTARGCESAERELAALIAG